MFDFLELFLYYVANTFVFVPKVGQSAKPGHPRRSPISGVFHADVPPKLFFKCFNEELPDSDASCGGMRLGLSAQRVRKINSRFHRSILACVQLGGKPMVGTVLWALRRVRGDVELSAGPCP